MPNPPISLVHPTGNPNSREAALALAEAELLHEVITTLAYNPNQEGHLFSHLPSKFRHLLKAELGRRQWLPPPGASVKVHPWREIIRLGLMRSGLARQLNLNYQALTDWIYLSLDRHVARQHLSGLQAIYAYEDGAAETFQAAKGRNCLCLYDLPIMFYQMSRRIQAEEADRFPELAPALQAAREPTWKIHRKHQEVALADHIFVASSITRQSLLEIGTPKDKISVIPYGAPLDYFQPQPKQDPQFRALYVGRVEPRKGIHYLLAAWKQLNLPQAELMLVGIDAFPKGWLSRYGDLYQYVPSVPHAALQAYYTNANVLVFPSLVEGFGLVLLEAMSCGIPVITTPHTAGPDIITDGVEGFIVPIRDPQALEEKLAWCYQHPTALAEMGRAARCRAEQLTWSAYRRTLADRVKSLVSSRW